MMVTIFLALLCIMLGISIQALVPDSLNGFFPTSCALSYECVTLLTSFQRRIKYWRLLLLKWRIVWLAFESGVQQKYTKEKLNQVKYIGGCKVKSILMKKSYRPFTGNFSPLKSKLLISRCTYHKTSFLVHFYWFFIFSTVWESIVCLKHAEFTMAVRISLSRYVRDWIQNKNCCYSL